MKIFKNQKGLTLVELLAVIVILGIVAAIAVPSIGNIINNSKDKAILADASTVLSAGKLAITDGSCSKPSGGTEGSLTCTATQLQPYLEGIKLDTNDTVTKTFTPATTGGTPVAESTVWAVKFDNLKSIKNISKFTVKVEGNVVTGFTPSSTATTITENALNKAMNQ